jgi:phosphoribosylanthranilate isomerase
VTAAVQVGQAAPAARLQLKVCGVTAPRDLSLLDEEGVDYAGVWVQIGSARSCADEVSFRELTTRRSERARCVAVVAGKLDLDILCRWLEASAVAAVQLHGFQLPPAVAALRERLPRSIEVFKVLHVQHGVCLERSRIADYAAAGVDAFLVDTFESRARLGSTGTAIGRGVLLELLEQVSPQKLIVAGGLTASHLRALATLGLRGVDVDTGARVGGIIDRRRVRALMRAARGDTDGKE